MGESVTGPGSLSHQRLHRLGSLWTPLNEASAGGETENWEERDLPTEELSLGPGAEWRVLVEFEAQGHTTVRPESSKPRIQMGPSGSSVSRCLQRRSA